MQVVEIPCDVWNGMVTVLVPVRFNVDHIATWWMDVTSEPAQTKICTTGGQVFATKLSADTVAVLVAEAGVPTANDEDPGEPG